MLYSLHHSGGIHNSARVCITGIVAQIDGLGIPRPKKNCTLQELLIYFGHRREISTNKQPAGLCKEDVIVLKMQLMKFISL